MAERTLAEAVADLRLSDRRIASDLAGIRGRLLTAVKTLEADAAISVRVKLNEDDVIAAFADLEKFAADFSPTAKVHLDSDAAVADLATLNSLAAPIDVKVNTDNAAADLAHLAASAPPITPPVKLSTENAAAEIAHLSASAPPITPAIAVDPASEKRIQDRLANLKAELHLGVDPTEAIAGGDRAAQRLAALKAAVGLTVDPTEANKSIDDIGRTAQEELPQDFEQAGAESGSRFGAALKGSVQKVVGTIGLAAGGFIATSLVTGFQRLTTIENATAQLTVQLGSAGDAAALLGQVLDVVRGTPFNLDQFAKAAANMVSFGIEAQKIPGYLRAIGEAAASQGGQANEVAQRLSTIFGQIATANRINGEDLLQFSEVGVNALTILGNHFGKTTSEIRDMISSGVVPAKQALDVLADGILHGSKGVAGVAVAFEGTMAKLRETLTGSIGGFKAATARFGVELIAPFKGALVAAFNGLTAVIDTLGASVHNALAGIADSDFAKSVVDGLKNLPTLLTQVEKGFSSLGPALAPLAGFIGASGLGQLRSILGTFGTFIPEISALRAAFVAFVAFTPELREGLIPTLKELFQILGEFGAVAGDAIGKITTALVPLFAKLTSVAHSLVPLVGVVASFGEALISVVVPAVQVFAAVLNKIPVGVIVALVTAFAGFKLVSHEFGVLTSATRLLQDGFRLTGSGMEKSATQAAGAMKKMEVAVAGAFAGMALTSKDAQTKITGAVGAIGAVALGFATGGPWGGAAAVFGVAIGAIAGHFVEAAREAHALKVEMDQMSTSFADATLEILKSKDALAEFNKSGVTNLQNDLGQSILGNKDAGKEITDALAGLNLPASGTSGAQEVLRIFQELAKAGGDLTKVPQIMDSITASFGDQAPLVTSLIDQYGSIQAVLDAIAVAQQQIADGPSGTGTDVQINPDILALINGGNLEKGGEQTLKFIDTLIAKQKELGSDDSLAKLARDQIDANIARNEGFRVAVRMAEAELDLDHKTGSLNDNLAIQAKAMKDLEDNTRGVINAQVRDALSAAGATGAQLEANTQQAKEMGVNLEDTAFAAGLLGRTGVDGFKKMRTEADAAAAAIDGTTNSLDAAQIAAKNLAADVLLSARAADEVGAAIDRMKGKLTFRTGVQDFSAAIRNVGTGFSNIINEADLKKAEGLNKSISDSSDRIAQLQVDVNKEADAAAAKTVDLKGRIDRARAAGAVGGVALLENELAHINDATEKKKGELDKAVAEAHSKAGELAGLATKPITALEQLIGQAKERGLSLFNLLLSAPTPEAQAAFQSTIAPVISQAEEQFIAEATKHPENVDALGVFYRQTIINALVGGGLDPQTADLIAKSFFNPEETGAAIERQAKLTKLKTKDSLRQIFEADPQGIKDALAALKTADPASELAKSLRDNLQTEIDKAGIAINVQPPELTDAEIADLFGFADHPIELSTIADLTTKVTNVKTDVTNVTGSVSAPTAGDTQHLTSEATRVLKNKQLVLEAQLALVPPDSAAAAKLQKEITSLITAEILVDAKVVPTLDTRIMDQQFKDWLVGHGLPAPALAPLPPTSLPRGAHGVPVREGGVFSESHIAQIVAAGSYRIFAEPETGGEGYIPLSPFKRERSTQIMGQIADMFGLELIPKGAKIPLPAAMVGGGGSRVSPGDADMIGRAVARHTKPTAEDRAASFAEQFEQGVHFERGAIVIDGSKTPRRTASQLVSRLAELAVKRR